MKKLYNKMINTMNSVSRKAVGTVNSMAFSARTALSNTRGEGYIDTAVKILIAVVLSLVCLACIQDMIWCVPLWKGLHSASVTVQKSYVVWAYSLM